MGEFSYMVCKLYHNKLFKQRTKKGKKIIVAI